MTRITLNDAIFMLYDKHLPESQRKEAFDKHLPDLVYYAILFQLEALNIEWGDLPSVKQWLDYEGEDDEEPIFCQCQLTLPFIGLVDVEAWRNSLDFTTYKRYSWQTSAEVIDLDESLTITNDHAATALAELCLQYHQHNKTTSIL